MRLAVPYYAQTSEFSCGPACVLMVMKLFDPALQLTRSLEFDVWRRCNMVGVRGADPYGLSVPLIDAGLSVRLVTRGKRAIAATSWSRHLVAHGFDPDDARIALFGAAENRRRALALGLPVTFARPTIATIAEHVARGFAPIALVHMGAVHELDIPHWAVISEVSDEYVTFNDPYRPLGRKGLRLPHAAFQLILDDVGPRNGMSPSVLFVRPAPVRNRRRTPR